MYSLNGFSLNEGHQGWRILRQGTNTQGGVTKRLNQLVLPGEDGYVPTATTVTEQVVILVVRTPRERLDDLLALCDAAHTLTRTDDPTKALAVQLASALPSSDAPLDAVHDVTITLHAYEGAWRDAEAVVYGPQAIASASTTHTPFSGLSAPIRDADVMVSGDFTRFTLLDRPSGATLRVTRDWDGGPTTGLLFSGSEQRAYLVNTSAPWTPISDVSQFVDVSAHGGFRITPKIGATPGSRAADLVLSTTEQTSVALHIRARRAYRMN